MFGTSPALSDANLRRCAFTFGNKPFDEALQGRRLVGVEGHQRNVTAARDLDIWQRSNKPSGLQVAVENRPGPDAEAKAKAVGDRGKRDMEVVEYLTPLARPMGQPRSLQPVDPIPRPSL